MRDERPVTKTDIVEYRRCPYAFWCLDRGLIAKEEYLPDAAMDRIRRGTGFHEAAVAGLATETRPVAEALAAGVELHEVPLRDPGRGIAGIIDVIIPAGGRLIPGELKHRRRVTPADRLELAFYWLLLEHLRDAPDPDPVGLLLLADRVEEVRLTPRHFRAVEDLIAGVRRARREGVRPRECACEACRGPLAARIARAVPPDDLTRVRGITRPLAARLERCGVTTVAELIAADPPALARALAGGGPRVSEVVVRRLRRNAMALRDGRPVRSADEPPLPREALYLDLEFTADTRAPHVWLAGVATGPDPGAFRHRWAPTTRDEPRLFDWLEAVLAEHPDRPVMTWNGASDLAALRRSAGRWGRQALHARIRERHVDLYGHTDRHIGMPTARLTVKDIAAHLGRAPAAAGAGIADGRDALRLFAALGETDDGREREQLMALLVDYNREDVLTVAAFHRHLLADAAAG